MKYTPEIVDRICSLLATGDYRIEDVCKQADISKETFYTWKETHPDFSDAIKKADKERLKAFVAMARSGMAKRLDIYEYDEITTEYIDNKEGKPKIKSRKVVRKFVMPSDTLIMYALNNQDADNFKYKSDASEADRDPPQPLVHQPVEPDGTDSKVQ